MPLHDYQVATVQVLDGGYTEIGLRPLGRRLAFIPGQFAMLYLEAKDGWHRHPFTISSAPEESTIRFAVKALGDDTSRARSVKPGMPAILGGAHGRFTYLRGTQYQAWIAGGIGITPFLSWLRGATNEQLPGADQRIPFARLHLPSAGLRVTGAMLGCYGCHPCMSHQGRKPPGR